MFCILTFLSHGICKYFLAFCKLFSCFVHVSFAMQKFLFIYLFIFIKDNFFHLFLLVGG